MMTLSKLFLNFQILSNFSILIFLICRFSTLDASVDYNCYDVVTAIFFSTLINIFWLGLNLYNIINHQVNEGLDDEVRQILPTKNKYCFLCFIYIFSNLWITNICFSYFIKKSGYCLSEYRQDNYDLFVLCCILLINFWLKIFIFSLLKIYKIMTSICSNV